MRALMGLAMVVALCLGSRQALAWGDEGHEIVCQIAFDQLTDQVKQKVESLGDTHFASFAESCTWPDHPRKREPEHFVNLPRNAEGLSANDPCAGATACVVTAGETAYDAITDVVHRLLKLPPYQSLPKVIQT